jgi:hypothetical protein
MTNAAIYPVLRGKIAGEGNRTPVCSLGSCRSAIELHPQRDFGCSMFEVRFASCDLSPLLHLFWEWALRAIGIVLQTKILVNLEQTLLMGDGL